MITGGVYRAGKIEGDVPMKLEVMEVGPDLLVRVVDDRIDAAAAVQFRDAMRSTTEGGQARVVLDLARVNFVDSSGLGAIIAVMKHLGAERTLELAGLQPGVAKVFRLTRLDEIVKVHADAEDAFGGPVHAG
jgi:anti-sigma B factor antagonist